MKITVKSTQVDTKSGTSKRTQKEYSIRTQKASAETDDFRQSIELTLEDDQDPYAVGEYTVDFDKSVSVGPFGDLRFKRQLSLVPIRTAAKQAA